MAYPIEYWQALLERNTTSANSNHTPNNKSYLTFDCGRINGYKVNMHPSFNCDQLRKPNQAVNIHFDKYKLADEPITDAEEHIGDIYDGEFKAIPSKQGFIYVIARPLHFDMKKTTWNDLTEDDKEDFLEWHIDKMNQLTNLL
ncbi:MAG: hypothetical protein ACPGVH_01745 [Chitinophagales bacterium]